MQEFMFMCVGLGFFLFCIKLCNDLDGSRHNRKMEEWREFGPPPVKRTIFQRFRD